MPTRFQWLTLGAAATMAGCTVSNPNQTGEEGTGTETMASGDADATATADSESGTADGETSGGADAPPTVGAVEVDQTSTPALVDSPRVVELRVDADDDNGVMAVEFYDGTDLIGAAVNDSGNQWTLDWALVGERVDGMHELTAQVVDTTNQTTSSAPTTLAVDMPVGGTSVWVRPFVKADGVQGSVLELYANEAKLLAGGQHYATQQVGQYAARTSDGADIAWSDTTIGGPNVNGGVAVDAVELPGGGLATCGYVFDSMSARDTFVAWYDADGNEIGFWRSNYNITWNDEAVACDVSSTGILYVAINTGEGDGRVVKFSASQAFDKEALLTAVPSDLDYTDSGVWVLGRKVNNTPRLDKLNGDLVEQSSSETIFGSSGLLVDETAQRIYTVGNEASMVGRLSAYDFSFAELWSEPFFPNETGSTPRDVAINIDGSLIVTGSTFTQGGTVTYSADGDPLWSELRTDAQTLFDFYAVKTDAEGYVYIAGTAGVFDGPMLYRESGLIKLNP